MRAVAVAHEGDREAADQVDIFHFAPLAEVPPERFFERHRVGVLGFEQRPDVERPARLHERADARHVVPEIPVPLAPEDVALLVPGEPVQVFPDRDPVEVAAVRPVAARPAREEEAEGGGAARAVRLRPARVRGQDAPRLGRLPRLVAPVLPQVLAPPEVVLVGALEHRVLRRDVVDLLPRRAFQIFDVVRLVARRRLGARGAAPEPAARVRGRAHLQGPVPARLARRAVGVVELLRGVVEDLLPLAVHGDVRVAAAAAVARRGRGAAAHDAAAAGGLARAAAQAPRLARVVLRVALATRPIFFEDGVAGAQRAHHAHRHHLARGARRLPRLAGAHARARHEALRGLECLRLLEALRRRRQGHDGALVRHGFAFGLATRY